MLRRESYLIFPDRKDANARFYTRVGTPKYLITKPIENQVNIVTTLVTRIKAWKSRNQWKGIVLMCCPLQSYWSVNGNSVNRTANLLLVISENSSGWPKRWFWEFFYRFHYKPKIITLHITWDQIFLTEKSRHYGILFMNTFYNVVNAIICCAKEARASIVLDIE